MPKREKEVKIKLVCDHVLRLTKIIGRDGLRVKECIRCYSFVEE